MAASHLRELVDGRATVRPLTVEQYHRMIETGILPSGEPYELLDGYLVLKDRSKAGEDPMTVGPDHSAGVELLGELGLELKRVGSRIRLQQPITIAPDSEPEPDAAVVGGTIRDYKDRHPGPADVSCVFEVADSSLSRDRSTKQRQYADAGIRQYVIVNLIEEVVEVYTSPSIGRGRYDDVEIVRRSGTLRIPASDGHFIEVNADQILP